MNRFGRLAVIVVFALLGAACSGGGPEFADDANGSNDSDSGAQSDSGSDEDDSGFQPQIGVAPTPTPLPNCAVEVVDRDTTWPYLVDSAVAPTEYVIDGLNYIVRGVTNDPESVLVNTMETSFPGYEVGEPGGSDTDITVEFTSDFGTAGLLLADDDGDNCWNYELVADYLAPPSQAADPGGTTGDGSGNDDTGADDPIEIDDGTDQPDDADPQPDSVDPLDEVDRVGVGQIITARGTFQLAVTTCSFDPVDVEAIAANGELRVEPSDDEGRVSVVWTYDDGVEVADLVARVLDIGTENGSFVADGENDEGPETLIIELTC